MFYLDMNEKLPDVSGVEKEAAKLAAQYKKGNVSEDDYLEAKENLEKKIEEGHSYQFVGKVGQFCPIKPGKGGGVLLREQNGNYYAATGTTGYRWLESEMVLAIENEDIIDRSYYDSLVDDAVDTISKYGDAELFMSDEPYLVEEPLPDFMNIPEDAPEELPWV